MNSFSLSVTSPWPGKSAVGDTLESGYRINNNRYLSPIIYILSTQQRSKSTSQCHFIVFKPVTLRIFITHIIKDSI